ncbi:MAG TPA: hypothetical protein VHL31_03195 [Geminicoccus sp.]|jgi:hypothetical protein|uniref:hypothetical protein n=1 Tax=Geminicoccus sp. TaxID=2024832 RepID=UPI002E331EEE|nr:hypothetical protein [Geminicoccus sp.]HEX2525292.1 hypothetical protein [Geminicoccus sp.]
MKKNEEIAAGPWQDTAANEDGVTHSVTSHGLKAQTARGRLWLITQHRRVMDPRCSGRLVRQIAAEIEAELFALHRWRRVNEDAPISEWPA